MSEAIGLVAAAAIGASATALGLWFGRREARQRLSLEAALKFVGIQLSELYAPLRLESMRLHQAEALFNRKTGRRCFANKADLPPESDIEFWYDYFTNVIMPISDRINSLLSNHADLVEGSEWPESFEQFVDRYTSWKFNTSEVALGQSPDASQLTDLWFRLSEAPFPPEFSGKVSESFRSLKRQHREYLDAGLPARS